MSHYSQQTSEQIGPFLLRGGLIFRQYPLKLDHCQGAQTHTTRSSASSRPRPRPEQVRGRDGSARSLVKPRERGIPGRFPPALPPAMSEGPLVGPVWSRGSAARVRLATRVHHQASLRWEV